jgi:hypothetical protein
MISNGAASAASSDWIAWPTVGVEHLDFLRQDRRSLGSRICKLRIRGLFSSSIRVQLTQLPPRNLAIFPRVLISSRLGPASAGDLNVLDSQNGNAR